MSAEERRRATADEHVELADLGEVRGVVASPLPREPLDPRVRLADHRLADGGTGIGVQVARHVPRRDADRPQRAERKGVCQDIAHVALGALRSVGIPARYVSGYLHPDAGAAVGETVIGESHAWVEWFAGEWRGYDPTNLAEVGELHVLVGRGRDYSDVPPLRGVYAGPGASELFVSVEVTRVA